jgi:hypothetical protein
MLTSSDMPYGYILVISDRQRLKIVDADVPEFGIDGYLDDGVLKFEIDTKLKKNGLRSIVRGKVLFDLMMKHYDVVDAIVGIWANGTNLDAFNKYMLLGKTQIEAASETWTGLQARRYGFTVISIDELVGNQNGYGWVRVYFRRSQETL